MTDQIIDTIRVCVCCMLSHNNGECCADDSHGGDGKEPLSLISDGYYVTAGVSEHSEYCTPEDRDAGCDCDQLGFSWQSCEGCGSALGGDRFALTLWQDATTTERV